MTGRWQKRSPFVPNVAEKVAAKGEDNCPEQAAKQVVENKLSIVHCPHTGDKGGEGADNRYKTSQYHRFAAVLRIETLSLLQIFPFEQPVILLKNAWADQIANPIINRVANTH